MVTVITLFAIIIVLVIIIAVLAKDNSWKQEEPSYKDRNFIVKVYGCQENGEPTYYHAIGYSVGRGFIYNYSEGPEITPLWEDIYWKYLD